MSDVFSVLGNFFSILTLLQLAGYTAVSVAEFVIGYLALKYLQDTRKWTRVRAFLQSVFVGLMAFVIRKELVFANWG